jgi:sulfite reductase (NADPH) flavoprotein alpha-component
MPTTDTAAAVHPSPPRRLKWPALPAMRNVWFQLHWFIGITAGTVLIVIGLTGATLSFREECLDLLNPGVRQVPAQAVPLLTPQQIAAALAQDGRRIASLTVYANTEGPARAAARVSFAAPAGQRRGETVYVHPYTGAVQPALQGAAFFEWIEALHRWLLLPHEPGSIVAGTLSICLLGMAASGLYLRWPRRVLDWRTWLTFDPALKGRSFLWGLHSVLGTWVLAMYLVLTATGIYWSFDAVRDTVDGWAGVRRPARMAMAAGDGSSIKQGHGGAGKKPAGPAASVDLTLAWQVFERQAPNWRQVTLRLPERPSQALQITWLAADAPHERARNRLSIMPQTGNITQDERYAGLAPGAQAIMTIYPLHLGTYFGLPGRILMFAAGLGLPLFAITGWMLYLDRRRQRRAVAAERVRLASNVTAPASGMPLLLAYASQSGRAERLALQSAGGLQRAGVAVEVRSLEQLAPGQLRGYRQALFVASSFGEGEPPDSARRFARLLREAASEAHLLGRLQFGVLALGDRHYQQFCGFGHSLEQGLCKLGAQPLFPLVEVDDDDTGALARWSQALAQLGGDADAEIDLASDAPHVAYSSWQLVNRVLLNPGSLGGPLFEITLINSDSEPVQWQAGALADILPRHSPAVVAAWLQRSGLAADDLVAHEGEQRTLAEALSRSVLPLAQFAAAQACADSLQALAPRRYSLASLPQDGCVQLLVRQQRHRTAPDDGRPVEESREALGLGSGWLTQYLPLNGEVELRLLDNPSFAPALQAPCIFIGNGSGFAGLRAHLRARVQAGQRRNWLLFGERQRATDAVCGAEIAAWQAAGFLARLDLAYSRDDAGQPVTQPYVQDRLRAAAAELRSWIDDGAVIYVCGSLQGMAGGVESVLNETLGSTAVEQLALDGRYRRDVY